MTAVVSWVSLQTMGRRWLDEEEEGQLGRREGGFLCGRWGSFWSLESRSDFSASQASSREAFTGSLGRCMQKERGEGKMREKVADPESRCAGGWLAGYQAQQQSAVSCASRPHNLTYD